MKFIFLLLYSVSSFACPNLSGIYQWETKSETVLRLHIKQVNCENVLMDYERNGEIVMNREFLIDGQQHVISNDSIHMEQISKWSGVVLSYSVDIYLGGVIASRSNGTFVLVDDQLIEDLTVYRPDGSFHSHSRTSFRQLAL